MEIKINDQKVFELTEIQKKVLCNDIEFDSLEEDCKRRLEWVLKHKYEQCFRRLKAEWEPKLKEAGVAMIPTDDDDFAQLVFSQPDYRCKKQREEKN